MIFDFDGTLADSFTLAHQVLNSLAKRYNFRPVADHEVEMMRRKTAPEFFAALGVSMIKIPFLAIQARHALRDHIAGVAPIPGIAEALPRLQHLGIRMGILTSNATENVDSFLRANSLQSFFDFTYCSRDMFGKARRIKALMRKYRLRPSSVIYVGDMDADIEAAKHAGIRIAAVSWGYQARDVLKAHAPTWLLDHPHQLAELFQDRAE